MPIKVAIADDKASNRNILQDKLKRHGHFSITLTAVDGSDFLEKMHMLTESELPDVVLMDLEMPNMDGVAAIAAGSSLYPQVKFVVLTIFDDEDKIFKAIKAGAIGYLLKDDSAESIADTLWQMYENGEGPISPGIAYKILQLVQKNELQFKSAVNKNDQNNFFYLTEREMEVLKFLAKGLGYKELGVQFDISVNTAKKHVINVYEKLHVHSRAQALKLAYEKGML
jgi:DNA-binding NarL/FixJ family response regulator